MDMDAAFFALADPTRRAILARLSRGEATVLELAEPFAMSQPAISKHLKVLERGGLIDRRIVGTTRPCRLRAEALAPLEQWLAMLQQALERNYARLDHLLTTLAPAEPPARAGRGRPRTTALTTKKRERRR